MGRHVAELDYYSSSSLKQQSAGRHVTELDYYSASSLKQQSVGRRLAPLGHIILIQSQAVFALSSYCVARGNKYQFYSVNICCGVKQQHLLVLCFNVFYKGR